jgi:hypothetical protein
MCLCYLGYLVLSCFFTELPHMHQCGVLICQSITLVSLDGDHILGLGIFNVA